MVNYINICRQQYNENIVKNNLNKLADNEYFDVEFVMNHNCFKMLNAPSV